MAIVVAMEVVTLCQLIIIHSGILRTGSFEVHLRYIKNEGGWSISVGMQPIDTKLSEKTKLVTKAHFDKQLSQ